MDETANQIEARIDRTRERLGSHLRELEDKVGAATDWRGHFRERPHLFLGAALIGGVVLASALKPKATVRALSATGINSRANRHGSVQTQALELWDNLQAALVGLAGARIKEYIGELVPGFDEQYRRAEQRSTTIAPTTTSIGRATV
jgi:hypothetical protein